MAQCAVRLCEICETSHGKSYCTNCDQYFCNNCKLSHLKAKVSKNHIFEDAANVDPEAKISNCERHDEMFTYYCETCSCLLCQICLPESHKKHEFSLIDEAASKKKAVVKSKFDEAESNMASLSKKAADLKDNLVKYKKHNETVVQDIEARREKIIDMVNEAIDKLIKKINDTDTTESALMTEKIQKWLSAVENDESFVSNAKKNNERQNSFILLQSFIEIENSLHCHKFLTEHANFPEKLRFVTGSLNTENIDSSVGRVENIKSTIGSQNAKAVNFKIGDKVRVRPYVKTPTYQWGVINSKSVGEVNRFCNGIMYVDFPEQQGWQAKASEMELVD